MHKDLIADYLIGMWVGIFLWLIIFAIIYFFCRKKKELRIGGIIVLIIAVIITGHGAVKTVLGVVDMNAEDYVTEEVICSKSQTKHRFLEHTFYITRQDGTSEILVGADSYPFGEYRGIVTYTKRSKIILDYKKVSNITE